MWNLEGGKRKPEAHNQSGGMKLSKHFMLPHGRSDCRFNSDYLPSLRVIIIREVFFLQISNKTCEI